MQLLNVLGTKNSINVVRHLIMHKDWEFNITELSKDSKINKGVLSRLIKKLEKENIINVNRKGKILLFKINKDNLFVQKVIIPFFEKEDSFFDDFIKDKLILKDRSVLSIILYGSYASGKVTLRSDVDVLVVVINKNKSIIEKTQEIKKNFLVRDMLLRIDIISLKEFRKLYKTKEPLIESIKENHKILFGRKLNELLE